MLIVLCGYYSFFDNPDNPVKIRSLNQKKACFLSHHNLRKSEILLLLVCFVVEMVRVFLFTYVYRAMYCFGNAMVTCHLIS